MKVFENKKLSNMYKSASIKEILDVGHDDLVTPL